MYVNIDIKKHVKHIVFIVALSILVIGAAIASFKRKRVQYYFRSRPHRLRL